MSNTFTVEIKGRTVRLTLRGNRYQAVWQEGKKRLRKSTGTDDAQAAVQVAERLLSQMGVASREMTLSDGLRKIWAERWQHQEYIIRYGYIEKFIERFEDPLLRDIDRNMLTDYRAERLEAGDSKTTANRKVSAVTTILRTARDEWEVIETVPRIRKFKEPKGRVTYLTDAEIDELLKTAKPPYDCVFRFLLATGLRINEFLEMRWRELDLTQYNTVTVQSWVAKTDEARTIPMPDDVVSDLVEELEAQEIDPAERPWPIATRSRLRTEWQRCRVLMGRDDDPEFVPHILRHTCATRLLHRGVPTSSVQKWLGHELITTTERYLHQSSSELRQYRNVGSVSPDVSQSVSQDVSERVIRKDSDNVTH